ncbi:Teichoic acid translocation permease protein TagG [Curvibacter sp. AEP1-3]|nr:Teichoic acid translocation permease protein TagG [Curvibacter sp. AEP1-3]
MSQAGPASATSALLALPATVLRYRGLLGHLIYREVHGRVTGSMLGVGWLVLHPLLLLAMYTLVFGVFMQSRWGAHGDGIAYFALALFPGLLVFNIFAECVNRASTLVMQNPNYVKKVVFPLELLIVPVIAAALVQFAIGFALWLTLVFVLQGEIGWGLLLVPLVLLPFVLLVAGVSWALAAMGVYFRDLGNLIPLVTQVLMFMSPVLYPLSNVPQGVRPALYLNPLTLVVEAVRAAGLQSDPGGLQLPVGYGLYVFVSIFVAWLGTKVFQGLRPGFADMV